MDFETWFRAEVIADRLYPAEEEAARRTWIAATGLAADICEQKAENAGDDEAYSVAAACAREIRKMIEAPHEAG